MTLVHTSSRRVRVEAEEILPTLENPAKLLRLSKYVDSVRKAGEGLWEVVFKWRKFGMTKKYRVLFRVFRYGNTVVYESAEDSPNEAKIVFTVAKDPGGWSLINATAEFGIGGLASLLGKHDFRAFVDELLDSGIRAHFLEKTRTAHHSVDCRNCEFYEATRSWCYALDQVVDHGQVPCGGAMFTPAET